MISVRAQGLGKAYRIYKRPFDSLKELVLRREYSETFWALRGVSLEVAKGGSLGIIGDNGAGKSTLLKLLAGATAPSAGQVERIGRVSAILSLGAGFHPDLSGIENIRIGCAILGLSPAETEVHLAEIVDFSELGSFVERPVRTYSSGMYLRLGFSVATAVAPQILIVDEHLSVGDQHFRFKCMRRIMALREAGCALVFCSHDLYAVGEVCERTLWLRDGRPAMFAATQPVLKAYQDHVRAGDGELNSTVRSEVGPSATEREHPADTYIIEAVLGGDCASGQIETGGRLELRIVAHLSDQARQDGVQVGVLIVRNDAVWCYAVGTFWDGVIESLHPITADTFGVVFVVDDLPLLSGEYSFTVGLTDAHSPHVYDIWAGAAPFAVRHEGKEMGVVRIPHRWERP
jgi:lipopolysaccharide transport system ATP-binding protein